MLTKMIQSKKVNDAKSTCKEKITSGITTYQLVGEIQRIKEAFWERNNKCKEYSLDVITKYIILCGESLFW